MKVIRKKQLLFLQKQNDEFMKLYRRGRFAEAAQKAESSINFIMREMPPGHPYLNVFRKNFNCARRKFAETAHNYRDISGNVQGAGTGKKQSCYKTPAVVALVAVLLPGIAIFNCGLNKASTCFPESAPYAEIAAHVEAFSPYMPEPPEPGIVLPSAGNSCYFQHSYKIKKTSMLDVPAILQNPELPRGCEVTSLAMLLQYAGITIDKMALARDIAKEPAFFTDEEGAGYCGNPHCGFVGNMYTFNEPGLGAYHGPVAKLMENCLPEKTIDLTGCCFEDILLFISEGSPVWALANARFRKLDPAEFQTWQTKQGPIEITYRQHAVLLTGYDQHYVYINDPLDGTKNKKLNRDSFQAAWVQMGSQALSYLPD